MLTAPLENSLTRQDQELKQGAQNIFILVHVALRRCQETAEGWTSKSAAKLCYNRQSDQ